MPEVCVTDVAKHLSSYHAVAEVCFFTYALRCNRLKITGPATAGVKLRVRGKQWRATTNTTIDAAGAVIPELTRERALGAFLAGNIKTFGC